MISKDSIWVDEAENGLRIDHGDEDGFKIVESEGESEVYVYYSELKKLIRVLQEINVKHI
jgi:hypothetical protein